MTDPWRFLAYAIALSVLVAFVWALFARQRAQMTADREVAWLLWHWFTGGPLERHRSEPMDDAQRLIVGYSRTSAVAAAILAEYLRSGAPHGTTLEALLVWGYGGAIVLALWLLLVTEIAVATVHHRRWVVPFHWAIYKDAGYTDDNPESTNTGKARRAKQVPRPGKYIRFPRAGIYGKGRGNRTRQRVIEWLFKQGWDRTGRAVARAWRVRLDGVVVTCALTFQNWDVKQGHVSDDAKAKLASDVRVTWHTIGRYRHVQFLPSAVLPPEVLWTDDEVRMLMERPRAYDAPLLGAGHNDVPIDFDLDAESPHMAISAGIGGGKSSLVRFVAAQILYHGGEVVILDVRQDSHRWARDLPGVRYAREIADIYDACIDIGAEVKARGKEAGNLGVGEDPDWQRKLVVIEELNSTKIELNAHYRQTLGGPANKMAPAVHELQAGIFKGRVARYHYFVAAQRFDGNLLGGAAKDMFYGRILARYKKPAWDVLAEGDYVPANDHKGWAMLCRGLDERPIQMGYIEETDVVGWLNAPGSRWVGVAHGQGRTLRPIRVLTSAIEAASPSQPTHGNGSEPGPRHPRRPVMLNGQAPDGKQQDHPPCNGVHGSEPNATVVASEAALDVPQIGQGAWNEHHSEPGAHHDRAYGQTEQHEADEQGNRLGVHVDSLPYVDIEVNDNGAGDEREGDPSGVPAGAGFPPAPQPHSLDRSVHPKTHSQSNPGSPARASRGADDESSTQAIQPGFDISEDDGGIEYTTLSVLSGYPWCVFTEATMERYARDQGHPFPKAAVAGKRGQPALFSFAAVKRFYDERPDEAGEPGNYVVRPPGSATVKIGETKELEERLRRWNLGMQCVLLWLPAASKKEAQDREAELHQRFTEYHDHLEWFWYRGRLVEWVEHELAKHREGVRT